MGPLEALVIKPQPLWQLNETIRGSVSYWGERILSRISAKHHQGGNPTYGTRKCTRCAVQSSLRQQFGKFLRERRGEMTLRDFARKAGLSSSTLQRLEQGDQNVTLDTLETVLKKLKVSITEVFGE